MAKRAINLIAITIIVSGRAAYNNNNSILFNLEKTTTTGCFSW
jgi:hypothetical protein